MIDQILAEIGIEGGSLSRMPGLIREARDMQGIRKETAPKRLPRRRAAAAAVAEAAAAAHRPRRGARAVAAAGAARRT